MHFPEPDQPWDGYGVVQAKFKQRPAGNGKDAAWFLRQLQAELETWANPESNRVRRGRVPQYVLFTTNVVLSPVAGSGGVDRVNALVARYADRLRLKGWRVWCATPVTRTPKRRWSLVSPRPPRSRSPRG
jgi:hypothetical protein